MIPEIMMYNFFYYQMLMYLSVEIYQYIRHYPLVI